jgi:hypothetical protein
MDAEEGVCYMRWSFVPSPCYVLQHH